MQQASPAASFWDSVHVQLERKRKGRKLALEEFAHMQFWLALGTPPADESISEGGQPPCRIHNEFGFKGPRSVIECVGARSAKGCVHSFTRTHQLELLLQTRLR